MITGKHFRCDCNWPFHNLYVGALFDDDLYLPSISVHIVHSPAERNLWQRIKAAGNLLRGREHVMSEIIIHRDDWKGFVQHVNWLDYKSDNYRQKNGGSTSFSNASWGHVVFDNSTNTVFTVRDAS